MHKMTDYKSFDNLETREPASVRKVQEELLTKHIAHISKNSLFYRKLFADKKIKADKICLDSLADLPFTEKSDLAKSNNDFLAVPPSQISEIVLTSGTTGEPTRIIYSENDMIRLAYNEEQALSRVGITNKDTVLLTCTMERCFIAGMAYYLGIRALGATAVRNGLNSLASHTKILHKVLPTVIVGVPSFLRKLGEFIEKQGINPSATSVSKLVCIGEPIRNEALSLNALGTALHEIWGADVYSTYASSETVTTFCECSSLSGGHLHPALGFVEIVDTKGKVLPAGEIGEVVMTPFLIEGMPLLRFKTGDVSFLLDERCACGRTSVRLGPILGRKNQMVKVQGTSLYLQAIFVALGEINEVSEYYLTLSSDFELSDMIKICISVNDTTVSEEEIARQLQARLRIKLEIEFFSEKEIRNVVYNSNLRKPVRVIDKRRGIKWGVTTNL